MVEKPKVQCDSKHFLADVMEFDNVGVNVYLLRNRKSAKTYCKDTAIPFKNVLIRYYKEV